MATLDLTTLSLGLAAAPAEPAVNGLAAYGAAFLQGVLVDLTPCVYPLIPITVALFGAKGVSRGRALFLATAYVLGMATLYTTLGIVVAKTGGAFGAWLGNPLVVWPVALLLLALAASMFGAFELQLPTSLQGKLSSVGGTGPVGAFLMGLVSGLISAPCTGPALLSLLALIAKASAQGQSVFFGGSLLFVYALGMGTLFFVVALGGSLFRPGPWMEAVKSVFGIALLIMAAWFLRPISPTLAGFVINPDWGLWLGMALGTAGIAAGAVHLSFHSALGVRLRKALAVLVATFGGIVALNNVLYVPPMEWAEVQTFEDFETAVRDAEASNKPILVDFAATWCTPCLEMEVQTFHDPSVEPLLAERFKLIKIDVTDPNEAQDTLKTALHGATLPSVGVWASDAKLSSVFADLRAGTLAPKPAAHFTQFVPAETFLPAIDAVR